MCDTVFISEHEFVLVPETAVVNSKLLLYIFRFSNVLVTENMHIWHYIFLRDKTREKLGFVEKLYRLIFLFLKGL